MLDRRTLLVGTGSTLLLGLAGCLDAVGMAEHTSTPIGVEAGAREETGYEQTGVEEVTVRRDVGAVGYSEQIAVHNHLVEHEKAIDMGPLGRQRGAVFSVLSTPKVSAAGRQMNPVEDMSTDELVDLIVENYDGIEDVAHQSDDEVTVLDESTTASTFAAAAEFDGEDVEVNLHVSEAVATDDDLVVSVGAYPRPLAAEERENVTVLMEAISTDVDVDGGGEDQSGADGGDGTGGNTEDGTDDDGLLGG